MTAGRELSVREAARLAHRSEETVRRWIWSGRLPARKHGNGYRVDVAHLERIAVLYQTEDTGRLAADNGLAAWLHRVDLWKQGLSLATASATAADLIIEDRRARR